MNLPVIRCLVFGWTILAIPGVARADPNPLALLRGVETAREPWCGKLSLTMTSEGIRPKTAKARRITMDVQFDREKRRYILEEDAFVVKAPKPGQRPTPGEQFEAMGQDRERALSAGIARMEPSRIRSIFDGARVLEYDEPGGAAIKDPKAGTASLCFDPRIIGLSREHVTETLSDALGYRTAKEVRMIGRETLRGLPLWHVLVVRPGDIEYHLWIEDREGYRVHRFEYRDRPPLPEKPSTYNVDSFYDKEPFPSKVVSHNITPNIEYLVTFTVEKMEWGRAPDKSVFGFAGLEMPPGERVDDYRIKLLAGYWDGKDLTPDRTKAVKRAVAVEDAKHRGTDWRLMAFVALAATVLLFLCNRFFRRRRA